MKNNYSIAQRNEIVEAHLWCIDVVLKKNRPLFRATRMERDDAYQQLAVRLIRAVATFDSDKGVLKQHIFAQLQYEVLNCKNACLLTGVADAPRDFSDRIISLDTFRETPPLYEAVLAA